MSQSKPNFLIFHCDQLRYDALGCHGHPGNPTPAIDALMAEGHSFSRHFVANPVCMPSRASFFTGLYPTSHGLWSNGVPLNRQAYLPFAGSPYDTSTGVKEEKTLADRLGLAGYRTGAFGKLHLTPTCGPLPSLFPENEAAWESGQYDDWNGPYYGFEHVEMTHSHGEAPGGHYHQWLRDTHPEILAAVEANGENALLPVPDVGDLYASVLTRDTHPSAWLGRQSSSWIEDRSTEEEPFFAFVGFPDPHHAFIPLQEDLDAFDGIEMSPPMDPAGELRPELAGCGQDVRHLTQEQHKTVRRYTAAMVRTIDRAVGNVIDTLKANKLWDNTVILFTSDHGDYLCDHGRLRKSHRVDTSLLHVPCILRLPERLSADLPRLGNATSNTDILPTFLELAGIEPEAGLQGHSLLAERPKETDYAYVYSFDSSFEGRNFTILDQRFRYTFFPESGRAELFDHQTDPDECENRSEDPTYAGDCQRLHAALAEANMKHNRPISGRVASW